MSCLRPSIRLSVAMIDCFKCLHFYITWDKHFPYGCKLMSFKSKRQPSKEVLLASGKECLGFVKKTDKDKTTKSKMV